MMSIGTKKDDLGNGEIYWRIHEDVSGLLKMFIMQESKVGSDILVAACR